MNCTGASWCGLHRYRLHLFCVCFLLIGCVAFGIDAINPIESSHGAGIIPVPGEFVRTDDTPLNELLGESPISMSHPCNSYNADTLKVLKKLGIKIGFRSNFEKLKYSKYEYPRIDHTELLREIN